MIAEPKNISAREAILGSICRNLAASVPLDAVHEEHHGAHEAAEIVYPASVLSVSELAGLFRENLISVGGNCLLANRTEVAELVNKIIAESEAKRVAISDAEIVQELKTEITGVQILENASKEELFS